MPSLTPGGSGFTSAINRQKMAVSFGSRLVKTVEMRFFTGLSVDETAEAMDSSPSTVKRDWQKARAFLYRELAASGG